MIYGTPDIIVGDCRDVLARLPERHFQTCVTSPPYFGLRDYGTATWEGGDDGCDHRKPASGGNPEQGPNKGNNNCEGQPFRDTCGKCGARRIDRQIGLEPTPDEFVACMVEVFRGVWRVLRDDGVLWLNLGDSYAGAPKGNPNDGIASVARHGMDGKYEKRGWREAGLKPKDLMGIPWRVAFALQADGWYLRDAIVWHKPSPMPGSQRDRCTSAYEFIFQLTKRPRYWFDLESVKETAEYGFSQTVGPHNGSIGGVHSSRTVTPGSGGTRTPRNVWRIASEGFSEAHFATFPREIPLRCIKAATSERGCCAKCGAAWERVVERTGIANEDNIRYDHATPGGIKPGTASDRIRGTSGATYQHVKRGTNEWRPTCTCEAGVTRCRVLDPFNGAGTTGLAACLLGRDYTGIELNPEYAAMSERRIARELRPGTYVNDTADADAPLFREQP